MTVDELVDALHHEATGRAYIRRLDILDQTASLIKARLTITPDLFVQVYRNDRFDTTNLALIHHGHRIDARDQLGGRWHRHALEDPSGHDRSEEGSREADLNAFLDEIEDILPSTDLP